MIRKISVQDVVSKRDTSTASDPRSRERDYLIERLTRKHSSAPIADVRVKTPKKQPPRRKRSVFGFGNKWIWISSPLVLILFAFVVLQFMFSATVTVKPKQLTVPVNAKLAASHNATTSTSTLMYQIITLSDIDSETVFATGTVATNPQKASGQITIFNNYSSESQTLIASTRFETADGLIYRIPNTIKIPGLTKSGGESVPGSVTVTVTADQVGSKYNIGMTDFTIPGFKNDANRYAKIFARSKTAMTGGSDGSSFGVSDTVRNNARERIEKRLKENLLRQVKSQKTADSVIFDEASKISFRPLADTAGDDAQHAVIHEQGTISAVVFDKKMLSKMLFGDAIVKVGNNAEIHGLENLRFSAAVSSTSPVWQAKLFDFTLAGSIDVVGVVDTNKLLQDVLGILRSDLTKVLSNYPTVDKAAATVKPFWKKTFPTDASKIKVEIVK